MINASYRPAVYRPAVYRTLFSGLAVALLSLCWHTASHAQPANPQSPAAQAFNDQPLAERQDQLAERYRKVEELLLRLADVEAAENPERAALLRRAARQSREKFILDRLETAAGSLSTQQYQAAIDNQAAAQAELSSLLKLLMTEDRPQRLRNEKEKISNWIKELKRMNRSERATRARTENGAELDDVESEQKSITERAREVERQLAEDAEAENGDPSDAEDQQEGQQQEGQQQEGQQQEGQQQEGQQQEGQQQEGQQQEGQQQEGQQQEGQQQEGQQQEGQQQEGQQQEGQQQEGQQQEGQQQEGQQQEGQQQEGQQQEGQQQEGQQQEEAAPKTPQEAAQRAVERARERMEEAEKKLKEAKRDEAVEAQRQAEQELRTAIEDLERILRQLREEEMLRELERLESRLREMAQMQSQVLDKTRQLATTPVEQRERQTDIRAGNLAFEEKKIVLEADRAILLLREEGSSVAFPELVIQVRNDMVRVSERLAQTKIDGITQGIQEDILASLEEMIGALQQAQRDLEEQQQQEQQQQQQQAGQSGERPLVEPLAELKLIRTMQTRVKSRTERYGEMIPDQPTEVLDPDLLGLLQGLSDRQQKLYRITRDLLLKRNK